MSAQEVPIPPPNTFSFFIIFAAHEVCADTLSKFGLRNHQTRTHARRNSPQRELYMHVDYDSSCKLPMSSLQSSTNQFCSTKPVICFVRVGSFPCLRKLRQVLLASELRCRAPFRTRGGGYTEPKLAWRASSLFSKSVGGR